MNLLNGKINSMEIEEKILNAENKIRTILMKWFSDDPVLLNVFSLFNLKPDTNQETIGINILSRNPYITYNPNFINTIQLEHLEMILVTIGFKVLLRHCTTRLKEPKQISSLASSITVDELLRDNTISFLLQDESLKDFVPIAAAYNLPEKDCFEEYFRQLYDKQNSVNEMIKDIWDSLTEEEKEKLINDKINQNKTQSSDKEQNKSEEESKEQQDNKDDNKDSNQSDSKDSDGFKEYDNNNDCVKDYFDPNGTSNDGWGTNDMMDAEIKNYIDKNKDKIKSWGTYTGNFIEEILAAQNSSFSFKEVIKRFRKTVVTFKTETSRLKLNRRHDLRLPGYRRQFTTRILFAIDESGSMDNETLSFGFATINKICKHIEMDYVTFDTEIKQIEHKFKTAKSVFKCSGRGGTDPVCVFDFAQKAKKQYNGIILFTDGYFDTNIKEPKVPVLWLLPSSNHKVPVKWGAVTALNRFENNHLF